LLGPGIVSGQAARYGKARVLVEQQRDREVVGSDACRGRLTLQRLAGAAPASCADAEPDAGADASASATARLA
jgi:hypothetical protein